MMERCSLAMLGAVDGVVRCAAPWQGACVRVLGKQRRSDATAGQGDAWCKAVNHCKIECVGELYGGLGGSDSERRQGAQRV